MNSNIVTRIPIPHIILKDDWYGIVYAIDTESKTEEIHNDIVERCISDIKNEFDNNSHYTVSLREVKREVVLSDENSRHYCTLIQFRVRDSY